MGSSISVIWLNEVIDELRRPRRTVVEEHRLRWFQAGTVNRLLYIWLLVVHNHLRYTHRNWEPVLQPWIGRARQKRRRTTTWIIRQHRSLQDVTRMSASLLCVLVHSADIAYECSYSVRHLFSVWYDTCGYNCAAARTGHRLLWSTTLFIVTIRTIRRTYMVSV